MSETPTEVVKELDAATLEKESISQQMENPMLPTAFTAMGFENIKVGTKVWLEPSEEEGTLEGRLVSADESPNGIVRQFDGNQAFCSYLDPPDKVPMPETHPVHIVGGDVHEQLSEAMSEPGPEPEASPRFEKIGAVTYDLNDLQPGDVRYGLANVEYLGRLGEDDNLITALAKANMNFGEVVLDQVNYFKRRYASLASIMKAIRAPLAQQGLVLTHRLAKNDEGAPVVETKLMHASGEDIWTEVPVQMGNDMQKLGSAITYAKRYGISMLLGVVGDEDDDGEAAVGLNDGKRTGWSEEEKGNGEQTTHVAQSSAQQPPKQQPNPMQVWIDKVAACGTVEQFVNFCNGFSTYEKMYSHPKTADKIWDLAADHLKAKKGVWDDVQHRVADVGMKTAYKAWVYATGGKDDPSQESAARRQSVAEAIEQAREETK